MRLRETIIRIVLMSLLLYSVVSFAAVRQDIRQTEKFAAELEQELELLLVENENLHRKISSGGDDDVIRALARERLGLVMPEDTVFYFTRDRREKIMEFETGAILEGKVTGITKFGAFVALPEGKSGLVHISELSNGYVNKVEDYVQLGQTVKVKLLSIGDAGKINLSIKRVEEKPNQSDFRKRPEKPRVEGNRQAAAPAPAPSAKDEFEDRLKKFMQESDSRIADNRMYADRKQRSRRR